MSAGKWRGAGLALCACVAGCSSASPTPMIDAGVQMDAAATRGPAAMEIDGDPNGIFWDDTAHVLYVAEDDGNRILRWTDGAGFALVRDLPAASPQGAGLGQLVRTSDGTIVVTPMGASTESRPPVLPPCSRPASSRFAAWPTTRRTAARSSSITIQT